MNQQPQIIMLAHAYPSHRQNSNNGRIYHPDGIAACLHADGVGWKAPLILVKPQPNDQPKTKPITNQNPTPHYRIRRLTPRECYRLMDIDDDRIDTLMNATATKTLKNGTTKTIPAISKTNHYRLAGNSIVVACLYHIFHKMFVDTQTSTAYQMTIFDLL